MSTPLTVNLYDVFIGVQGISFTVRLPSNFIESPSRSV